MHPGSKHDGERPNGNWSRKHAFAIRLASCFFSVTVATIYVVFYERSGPTANLIWVANGVLLAHLLLAPRWRWRGYLIAGFAGMTFGSALIREPWRINLLFNVLNLVEVLVAALLLRRKSTQLPRFTDRRYLVRFVASALLAGPVTAGALLSLVRMAWGHQAPMKILLDWVIGNALGNAIVVPIFVAIFDTRSRNFTSLRTDWQYPLTLVVVTAAAFSQDKMPLFILIFPILVLLLMRMGISWAALATLFIAASASWYSIHGSGPFALSGSAYSAHASIQLQFFVACCLFMIYLVSVILKDRDATQSRLLEITSLHSIVTDYSRDAILLADLEGRCTFVSPSVEVISGWKPEELVNQSLAEQAHPADRERLEHAIRHIRNGAESDIVEYRTQKRNGDYVWVESSLRLFFDRKSRIPTGLLSLVRDISERKHSEGLLLNAYEALKELAAVDALTGVANRRRFNEHLTEEWSRSERYRIPISLLLIDADSFKEHNDAYGHLCGDRYLKRIAEAATTAAKRPGDLVARFGGDEFAVLMPGTDNQAATTVGNKIREILKQAGSVHDGHRERSPTISVGCATLVPKLGEKAETLIQSADGALYQAKRNGRDQMCCVCSSPPFPGPTGNDSRE